MTRHEADMNSEWIEVRPGRWERGLDETEQVYTTIAKTLEGSGRSFAAITGHISIISDVPTDISVTSWEEGLDVALRSAWLALRNDQPAIASWTEWNVHNKNFVKAYERLEQCEGTEIGHEWLTTTFKIVTGFTSGQHFSNSDPPAPKLPTLFVVKPVLDDTAQSQRLVRRDLVLRSHHDIMDGLGALYLLEKLLTHTTRALYAKDHAVPPFNDEWKRLSPSLRYALGTQPSASEEVKELYDEIMAHKATLSQDVEVLTLPYQVGAVMPGKHQRVEITLSEENTKRVLAACKKRGVSVTHAYHAAVVIALSQLQRRESTKRSARYITFGLVNLRSKCKEPFCTSEYGASVYSCGAPQSLVVDVAVPASSPVEDDEIVLQDRRAEFDRVVEVIKSFYIEIREDKHLLQLFPLILRNLVPDQDWASPEPMPVPPPPTSPSVHLSSMGVIDNIIKHDHGNIKVYNPWVSGDELKNGFALYLRTYRGELCLSAVYNEAWQSSQAALEFIRNCDEIVQDCLHTDS